MAARISATLPGVTSAPSSPCRNTSGIPPTGEVIDGIKSIEAKYPGLEHFMIHWAEGLGPQEFQDQLRRFAKDVMPYLREQGTRAPTRPVAEAAVP